jgi:arylsulfatase A-like enzyme
LTVPEPLNLLFIFTDEQATATMAAYGNDRIRTPNLDALAADSVVFDRAYVTQPVCTPSRSTLMTGLYPHTNGCTANNIPLPEHVPCLPELGDFSGYATGYHGKWHLGDEMFAQHGFEEWRGIEDGFYRPYIRPELDASRHSTYSHWLIEHGYEPDKQEADGYRHFSRKLAARLPERFSKAAYVANESSRFIRENRDRPFLLCANFLEPHMPFTSCRDDQYDPAEVPLPASFDHEFDAATPLKVRAIRRMYRQRGTSGLHLRTEADWRRLVAIYWGLVSLVDTHVGRVLDALREAGLWERTVIVFTSDHGDMMGAHRLVAKCTMYEEAVRVPLLLRIPGVTAPGRVAEPVSQVDLVPTLLEALGQEPPGHLQGFSWLPRLKERGPLAEPDVFLQWNGSETGSWNPDSDKPMPTELADLADESAIRAALADPVRTIITPEGWKYTRSTIGEDELYHLTDDPHEMTNLADRPEQADRVADLRGRIEAWQARTGDSVKW